MQWASGASWALPAVCVLIGFLSYSSQYLFRYIDPGPLDTRPSVKFNLLIACIWICYYRACSTDAGQIPAHQLPPAESKERETVKSAAAQRWCRKCRAPKPPRAHHCKQCKRCIPKMDHHCPWTGNCVSHTTYPHFIRFVFYAVVTMTYLEYFLFLRVMEIWRARDLPSYLGPSPAALIHLFILIVVNSITLFALFTLLVRSLWSLGGNVTTIEGWEIDRHHALLRRARILGGYVYGPDGQKVTIQRQIFPYDIGIWKNIKQGMGGSVNILQWFWPFAATPSVESGMDFEVNGFEDPTTIWPPVDPERMPQNRFAFRSSGMQAQTTGFIHADPQAQSSEELIRAFKARQIGDLRRRGHLRGDFTSEEGSEGAEGDIRVEVSEKGQGGGGQEAEENENDRLAKEEARLAYSPARYSDGGGDAGDAGDHDYGSAPHGGGEEAGSGRLQGGRGRTQESGRRGLGVKGGKGGKWTNAEGEVLSDFGVDEDA